MSGMRVLKVKSFERPVEYELLQTVSGIIFLRVNETWAIFFQYSLFILS